MKGVSKMANKKTISIPAFQALPKNADKENTADSSVKYNPFGGFPKKAVKHK